MKVKYLSVLTFVFMAKNAFCSWGIEQTYNVSTIVMGSTCEFVNDEVLTKGVDVGNVSTTNTADVTRDFSLKLQGCSSENEKIKVTANFNYIADTGDVPFIENSGSGRGFGFVVERSDGTFVHTGTPLGTATVDNHGDAEIKLTAVLKRVPSESVTAGLIQSQIQISLDSD